MTAVTLDASGSCPWGDIKAARATLDCCTRAVGQAPIVSLYPHSLLCSCCVCLCHRGMPRSWAGSGMHVCLYLSPHPCAHLCPGRGILEVPLPPVPGWVLGAGSRLGAAPWACGKGENFGHRGIRFVCSTAPLRTLHTRRALRASSPLTLSLRCQCTRSLRTHRCAHTLCARSVPFALPGRDPEDG